MAPLRITMLNHMAGRDLEAALDRHREWGLRDLDLKNFIFGKAVGELDAAEAERVREMAAARDLRVYCFSSTIFWSDLEEDAAAFQAAVREKLERLLAVAAIVRPVFVRLLAAPSSRRAEFDNCAEYLEERHPWLLDLYREAVDRIDAAGFRATIENEKRGSIFANPREITDFFARLDRPGRVSLTWDIANMLESGTAPDLEVYRQLKPLIAYCHFKGGRRDEPGGPLWRSSLAEAGWPVREILRQVAADGVSPVICLNPSHGRKREGQDLADLVERDLEFLRANL